MQKTFLLKGLNCPNCSAKIERLVGEMDGVSSSSLNLIRQTLVVTLEPSYSGDLTKDVERIVLRLEPDVRVIPQTKDGHALSFSLTPPSEMPPHPHEHHHAHGEHCSCGHDHHHEHVHHEHHPEHGEHCCCEHDHHEHQHESDEVRSRAVRLIFGAVVYAAGMALGTFTSIPFSIFLGLLAAAYIIIGGDVVLRAAKNISRGQVFDENFLMCVSSIGAFIIGEYPEAVAVMLFYQVGEFFQNMAVEKSRRSIAALMDIRPDSASVKRGQNWITVSPEEVTEGDLILVKPGEKVPLDGTIMEGSSALDAKALTGESLPRSVTEGDTVLSGCINESGALVIKVTKTFENSTAAKIIDLVENAASRKAPSENFITKFARYYTPVVVFCAIALAIIPPLALGGAWADWVHRAFVFLVVSCPCALVISIPLTFFGGIGAASRKGILVKGGNYLEALNSVDTIVFDKTGTLTKGTFQVAEILPAEGISAEDLLDRAACAEALSSVCSRASARSMLPSPGPIC